MNSDYDQNKDDTKATEEAQNAHENNHAESSSSHSTDPFERFSEAVRSSFERGEARAKQTLHDAIPKAKQGLLDGVKELAYGAGFAGGVVSFIAREIVPEDVKESFRTGSEAGRERAASWKDARDEKGDAGSSEVDGTPATA